MDDVFSKEWLEDGAWCKKVILTLLRWASIQPNPWIILDANITDALEKICDAFYGDSEYLEHGIATMSTTFCLVCALPFPGFKTNISLGFTTTK